MTYQEYSFALHSSEEFHKDLLIDSLSEIGFDTFEDTPEGFKAYIPSGQNIETDIDDIAEQFAALFTFTYQIQEIPHQNWNAVWESNFQPIRINDSCYVRATFHEPHPEYEFEIIVDPKMAFGTGHHQTTSLMMQMMMSENFKGKKVLDMGCGTGILAILASKLGASELVAIDYDEICFDSTIENSRLNHVNNIKPLCGSKEVIPDEQFDVILANINRNILLDQMERYFQVLSPGGNIFFSGFYEEPDLEIIRLHAAALGLKYAHHQKLDNWVAAKFTSS